MENATTVSLPPLSLLFNQALSVARAATVVCCLSLGKCRPKWLLCAEAQTTGTQRVLLEPSVPAVGLTVANTHNE